jgi:hypothetical protein
VTGARAGTGLDGNEGVQGGEGDRKTRCDVMLRKHTVSLAPYTQVRPGGRDESLTKSRSYIILRMDGKAGSPQALPCIPPPPPYNHTPA